VRTRLYLRGEQAFNWLGRRHPRLYRLARLPWRRLTRLLGVPTYWDRRSHYRYYAEVVRLAREHVPDGGRVLDVGAYEAELLRQLDWFDERLALDLRYIMPRQGVKTLVADFRRYEPDGRYDLVLCLQVLEHLRDPDEIARKLLRTGRTVIVSVPYMWGPGGRGGHLHDPVDEAKLRLWTDRDPDESLIVDDDGRRRLIAVYARG